MPRRSRRYRPLIGSMGSLPKCDMQYSITIWCTSTLLTGTTGTTPQGSLWNSLTMEPQSTTIVVDAIPRRSWPEILAALSSLLELSQGQFTLVFVVYEWPSQRQRIVSSLQQTLHELYGWTLVSVSLQDPALDLRNLSGRFFETLQEIAQRQSPSYDAVLLLDWEQRLAPDQPPERQPSTSLVGVFNVGRHLLEKTFACPVVVLVPQTAMRVLMQLAPDFVSWQSGAFFVPYDEPALEAELRAAVTEVQTVPSQQHEAALERLEASLRDILAADDTTLPVELIAEALSAAAELSLKLG